jgi:hypothetical protein
MVWTAKDLPVLVPFFLLGSGVFDDVVSFDKFRISN